MLNQIKGGNNVRDYREYFFKSCHAIFPPFYGNKKAQSAFKTINMFWNAFCAHERKQLDAYRSGSGFDQWSLIVHRVAIAPESHRLPDDSMA